MPENCATLSISFAVNDSKSGTHAKWLNSSPTWPTPFLLPNLRTLIHPHLIPEVSWEPLLRALSSRRIELQIDHLYQKPPTEMGTVIAKPHTSSACIQAAIQKSIQPFTPALKRHVDYLAISEWVTDVSDDVLERACHTGELTMDQCFLNHLCRFPAAEVTCGYFSTMKVQLFSAHTLALIVTTSDLNFELISERNAAELIRIIFGVLFRRVDRHQLQRSFDDLFNPIIESTHIAFTAYNKQKDVHSKTQRRRKLAEGDLERFASENSFRLLHSNSSAAVQLRLGPIGQAVATVSEFASREFDALMEIARGCPAAFVTGFKLGLLPPEPRDVVAQASSYWSPSPSTSRLLLTTPRLSKHYLRASAPSPSAAARQPCELLPNRQPRPLVYYASTYTGPPHIHNAISSATFLILFGAQ
ncbi:hypothetical protein C8R45DRAFT_1187962 [Mycena sanguinolenta]|nr:hypothetical protein C8R45DRAFT_1187962 [Mycena sanguinolenta]